jgi:hypothetical protein
MEVRFSTFGNRYVIIIFGVQIVGWIGLVATFDHSPGPVVDWVQMLPELARLLLLPLAILSIPAVGIALGVGWVLSLGGLPPESIPPLLIARGDVLVFASAYAVAVGSAWVVTRITGSEYFDDNSVA